MLNVADHADYFTLRQIALAFKPCANRITARKICASKGLVDHEDLGRLRCVVFLEHTAFFQRNSERLKE